MTAPTDTTPDTQIKVSAYILFPGADMTRAFDRTITWSFYQADTGEDPWREERLGSPLASEYHDEARDALAAWAEVCGVTFTEAADGADVHLRIGFLTPEAAENSWGLGGEPVATPLRSFAALAPYIADVADGNEDWIYNLLLHEIGHALLIGHSDIPGTVMLPDGFGPGRADLMPDDIAAVQAIWGPPPSVPPDLTEPGRLFEPTHAVAWRGTAGDDTFSPVVYGALDDLFAGGLGADYIEGGNGNDTLLGNGIYCTGPTRAHRMHACGNQRGRARPVLFVSARKASAGVVSPRR